VSSDVVCHAPRPILVLVSSVTEKCDKEERNQSSLSRALYMQNRVF
jgi:hypothetical protein